MSDSRFTKKRLLIFGGAAALLVCLALLVAGFIGGWFSGGLFATTEEASSAISESALVADTNAETSAEPNLSSTDPGASSATASDATLADTGNVASDLDDDTPQDSASGSNAAPGTGAQKPSTSSTASEPSGSSGAATTPGSPPTTTSTQGEPSQPSPNPNPAPTPEQPQTITVSIYVDSSQAAGRGYPACMASQTLSLSSGQTVYDALRATGLSLGGNSSYVRSIGGLAEFDLGVGSGWLYSVNGTTPGYSCGSYKLWGGENIRWIYTAGD